MLKIRPKLHSSRGRRNCKSDTERGGTPADKSTAPPDHELEADDGFRLQALGSLLDFEFHGLALIESLVTLRLNGAVVDENVFATLPLNEPIALACVKPLDRSLFSTQLLTPQRESYLRSSSPPESKKKAAQGKCPQQPRRYLKKQSQEQQTQQHYTTLFILRYEIFAWGARSPKNARGGGG